MIDLTGWKKGINIPQYKTASDSYLNHLVKRERIDHVRILPLGVPTFPGDEVVRREDNSDVELFYNRIAKRKLKLIIATESWAQEHTKWFVKCTEGDFTHLDEFLLSMARTISKFDSKKVLWELISEPGWFFRDTQLFPHLDTHEKARAYSTEILMQWFDHIMPQLRKECPETPFLLPGPGWGSPCGPGEWQDLDISKWGKVAYRIHLYAPRNLTLQNGSVDFPYKNYIWPDRHSTWKLMTDPSKLGIFDYEFNYKDWAPESLQSILQDVQSHFKAQNKQVFVSEYGGIDEAQQLESVRAYNNDMTQVMTNLTIPGTKWRWANG